MPGLLDSYCTFYLEYPWCQNLLWIKKNVETTTKNKKQKKDVLPHMIILSKVLLPWSKIYRLCKQISATVITTLVVPNEVIDSLH